MRNAEPNAVTSPLVVLKVATADDERFCSVITPRLSCPHTSDSALLRKLQNTWRAKVAHPGTGRRLARQLVPAGDLKQFSSGRVQTRSRHDSHSHTESYRRLCCRTRCYSRGPHHRSVREASDYTSLPLAASSRATDAPS